MITHFVKDEKVTDQIIQNFGRDKFNNHFLVFKDKPGEENKFINANQENISEFIPFNDDINLCLENLGTKIIFCHAFHLEFALVINKLENRFKIAWYTWGFDIYGLPKIKPFSYAPLTENYLRKANPFLWITRAVLKNQTLRKIFCFVFNKQDRYGIVLHAMKKVGYMITYMPNDYQMFVRHYDFDLKFLKAPFSTIEQYLGGNKREVLSNNAQNILVGNSNTIECNHLDALDLLFLINLPKDTKVYVPLSYGTNMHYKDVVVNEGKSKLGDQFYPMLDFMNRNEYLGVLKSCSVGIFCHYRQQAMGNIIAMLYMGARVYLSNRNPAFQFLKSEGLEIFSVEDVNDNFNAFPLELGKADANRKILESIFSENEVLGRIDDVLFTITQDSNGN